MSAKYLYQHFNEHQKSVPLHFVISGAKLECDYAIEKHNPNRIRIK